VSFIIEGPFKPVWFKSQLSYIILIHVQHLRALGSHMIHFVNIQTRVIESNMDFPRNLYIENAKLEGHSDAFIENTLNYADNLICKNLPVIFSLKHFAIITKMDYGLLKSIVENRDNNYEYYLIKKKKGGYRRIIAPHSNIKELQRWIKINIIDKIELNPNATGFIKEKSILNNAKTHENRNVILNLDLSNFFETINERRVYGMFKMLGYAPNLSVELAKICTTSISDYKLEQLSEMEQEYFQDLYFRRESFLVQGAPTSPGISNVICKKLDNRLSRLANKHGANYSRYADDITFSGNDNNLPNLNIIKKIIVAEGFNINWGKVGKYKTGQKQMVTGLLIDNKVRIPKKFKKEIYRHLHFCKKYGASSHFNRISPDKGYRKEWMLGKILFVHSIEPDEAKKMMKLVEQINWEI